MKTEQQTPAPKADSSSAAGSVAGCGYHISATVDCDQPATTQIRYPLNKRWMPACSKHAKIAKAFGWEENPPPPTGSALPPIPTDPLDRLALFLGNRESVQRRTGFTVMADDYAAQLAALQTLRRDHAQLLKVWREQCDEA